MAGPCWAGDGEEQSDRQNARDEMEIRETEEGTVIIIELPSMPRYWLLYTVDGLRSGFMVGDTKDESCCHRPDTHAGTGYRVDTRGNTQ
jgi:hypothetical protein